MNAIYIYEMTDFNNVSPIFAQVSHSVDAGFAVEILENGPECAPAVSRLQEAVKELSTRPSLKFRRGEETEEGLAFFYDDIPRDSPAYILAAAQVLSREFDFETDWDDEDWDDE